MINSTHAQYRTNGGGGDYQDDDYGSGAGGGASGYDRYGDDGSSAAGSYGMEPDTLYHDYAAHQQEKALRRSGKTKILLHTSRMGHSNTTCAFIGCGRLPLT